MPGTAQTWCSESSRAQNSLDDRRDRAIETYHLLDGETRDMLLALDPSYVWGDDGVGSGFRA